MTSWILFSHIPRKKHLSLQYPRYRVNGVTRLSVREGGFESPPVHKGTIQAASRTKARLLWLAVSPNGIWYVSLISLIHVFTYICTNETLLRSSSSHQYIIHHIITSFWLLAIKPSKKFIKEMNHQIHIQHGTMQRFELRGYSNGVQDDDLQNFTDARRAIHHTSTVSSSLWHIHHITASLQFCPEIRRPEQHVSDFCWTLSARFTIVTSQCIWPHLTFIKNLEDTNVRYRGMGKWWVPRSPVFIAIFWVRWYYDQLMKKFQLSFPGSDDRSAGLYLRI